MSQRKHRRTSQRFKTRAELASKRAFRGGGVTDVSALVRIAERRRHEPGASTPRWGRERKNRKRNMRKAFMRGSIEVKRNG